MAETPLREIVKRRFGRNHDLPCVRPSILTCAMWECQKAGYCQYDIAKSLGTGRQVAEYNRKERSK